MQQNWDRNRKFKCVYFLKSQNLVKIGASARLYQRIMTFKIDNPDIELIGLLLKDEHINLEQELHQQFDIYHHKGEWFKESEDIYKYIKEKMNENEIKEMNNFNIVIKTNGVEKSENRKQFEASYGNKEVSKKSKPIDAYFGEETQIRIKLGVRDMLENTKLIPRESANDCIKRLILENHSLKKEIKTCKEEISQLKPTYSGVKMDISEIGNSVQIRILHDDGERLKKLKLVPEEPWYKVITRVLDELETLKKQVELLEKGQVKQG